MSNVGTDDVQCTVVDKITVGGSLLDNRRRLVIELLKWIGSIFASLAIAILSYVFFYSICIPKHSLTMAIHFQHDIACEERIKNIDGGFKCRFPYYEVPYPLFAEYFTSFYSYHFSLVFELPDSPVNRHLGMFMATIRLYDVNNHQLVNVSRPAIIPYQSRIVHYLEIPVKIAAYFFGYSRDKHRMEIALIDRDVHTGQLNFGQVGRIRLEIETHKPIEILPGSKLYVSAMLEGLLYLMYFWPLTTFVISVTSIFTLLMFLFVCYQFYLFLQTVEFF